MAEESKPDSMLAWYKSLVELKKSNDAFAHGNDLMLDTENDKVLSWLRQSPDGTQVLVSCNFTADPQTINLTNGSGVKSTHARTLLKSPSVADPASLDSVQLPAFGVWIGQVE
jgi:alpha-glucosidase